MLYISKLKKTNINKDIVINKGETSNEIKHYPASTKEWFNSIYNFNKNYQKDIPSLDISILKIIKNYFNMFSSSLEKSILMFKTPIRKRRLKLNKILIGKPEFKHTNDKLIITLYVYNRELSLLNLKKNILKRKLLFQFFFKILSNNKLTIDNILNVKNLTKDLFNLGKRIKQLRINKIKFFKNLKSRKLNKLSKIKLFNKNYSMLIKKLYIPWSQLKNYFNFLKKKGLNRIGKSISTYEGKIKNNNFINKSDKVNLSLLFFFEEFNVKYLNKYINNIYNYDINKITFFKTLKKLLIRMRLYIKYNRIIQFNRYKFNIFLNPLKIFLENIYKKDVEFNIISLKNYNLDSNLFTQVISTKLKNRKNSISKILNKILSKIKLPISRRFEYNKKITRNKNIQNIIIRHILNKNNLYKFPIINIDSLNKHILDKRTNINLKKLILISRNDDKLNNILKGIYSYENVLKKDTIKLLYKRNIENIVLDSIKNKFISGIRVEGSGRLSKRIAAARSTYKVKQIGTIRNINSSYKKIPSLLLRGNHLTNLQFTKVKNKTRIGSFGLKGWINSV